MTGAAEAEAAAKTGNEGSAYDTSKDRWIIFRDECLIIYSFSYSISFPSRLTLWQMVTSKRAPKHVQQCPKMYTFWTHIGPILGYTGLQNVYPILDTNILDMSWISIGHIIWTFFGYKLASNIMSNNMPNRIPFLDIILEIILDSSLYPNNVQKFGHFGA
jgi:hypothetical protein